AQFPLAPRAKRRVVGETRDLRRVLRLSICDVSLQVRVTFRATDVGQPGEGLSVMFAVATRTLGRLAIRTRVPILPRRVLARGVTFHASAVGDAVGGVA